MALGSMSKGLLGLVLPLLAAALYLALTGPLRAVPRRVGLWPGLARLRRGHPGLVRARRQPATASRYLRETIVHQQVERYTRSWVHRGPWYQYLGDFATGFLPWSLFVPGALVVAWQAWRDMRRAPARDGNAGSRPVPLPALLVRVRVRLLQPVDRQARRVPPAALSRRRAARRVALGADDARAPRLALGLGAGRAPRGRRRPRGGARGRPRPRRPHPAAATHPGPDGGHARAGGPRLADRGGGGAARRRRGGLADLATRANRRRRSRRSSW